MDTAGGGERAIIFSPCGGLRGPALCLITESRLRRRRAISDANLRPFETDEVRLQVSQRKTERLRNEAPVIRVVGYTTDSPICLCLFIRPGLEGVFEFIHHRAEGGDVAA